MESDEVECHIYFLHLYLYLFSHIDEINELIKLITCLVIFRY